MADPFIYHYHFFVPFRLAGPQIPVENINLNPNLFCGRFANHGLGILQ